MDISLFVIHLAPMCQMSLKVTLHAVDVCCLVRLLFPERSSFINEFFALSGVNPRLRAQQLTLQQWGQLCSAYIQLAGNLEM
jgi:hypothetical protein